MNDSNPATQIDTTLLTQAKQDKGKPSTLCAVLAASMPLLFAFVALIVFIISLSELGNRGFNLLETWSSIGVLSKWTLTAGTMAGIVGCTAFLALAGLGKRISAAPFLFLAALPWIGGALCSSFLTKHYIVGILEEASGAEDISAVASGLADAIFSRWAGSLIAGCMLCACAIGLALAAIGQRASGKRAITVFLLTTSGIPLLVFTPWWIFRADFGGSGLLPIMMAGGVVGVAILAGVGTPASSPNARNWPLATAATGASWMAFMATVAFCSSLRIIKAFSGMAVADGSNLLNELTLAAKSAGTLFLTGGALSILPMLVLALMAFAKTRIKPGWVAGAAACLVLVFGGTLLMDQIAARSILSLIQKLTSPKPSKTSIAPPFSKSESSDLSFPIAPPPSLSRPSAATGTGEAHELTGIVGGIPNYPPPPPYTQSNKSSHPREPSRIGGNILETMLIKKVEPIYPDAAKRAQTPGRVMLMVTVDEEGNVSNIQTIAGDPLLAEAAVNAVRQWKYAPMLINGEPVPVMGSVRVVFK
jgi:TonB family protein